MAHRNSWSRFFLGIATGVLIGGGAVVVRNTLFAMRATRAREGAVPPSAGAPALGVEVATAVPRAEPIVCEAQRFDPAAGAAEPAIGGRDRVPNDKLPTSRIVGTVVDARGAGIAGAVLAVVLSDRGYSSSGRSDGSGRFEFGPIAPASVTLCVLLPSLRAIRVGKFGLAPGATTDLGTIRIPEPGAIEIVATYENVGMRPLEAGEVVAEVYARDADLSALPIGLRQIGAAKFDGHAILVRDLIPGEYALVFANTNYANARRVAVVKPGETTRVEITLRAGAMRTLVFRFADRAASADMLEFAIEDSQGNGIVDSRDLGIPRGAGAKKVFWLPAGRYRVVARSSSGRAADATLDLPDAEPPGGEYEVVLR